MLTHKNRNVTWKTTIVVASIAAVVAPAVHARIKKKRTLNESSLPVITMRFLCVLILFVYLIQNLLA